SVRAFRVVLSSKLVVAVLPLSSFVRTSIPQTNKLSQRVGGALLIALTARTQQPMHTSISVEGRIKCRASQASFSPWSCSRSHRANKHSHDTAVAGAAPPRQRCASQQVRSRCVSAITTITACATGRAMWAWGLEAHRLNAAVFSE
ncbi:unnamed protein product, partial [Ectocarpus sp. 12 AP-2014]